MIYTLTLNSAIEEVIYADGDNPSSIDNIRKSCCYLTGKAVNTGLLLSNINIHCNINIVCGENAAELYEKLGNDYRTINLTKVSGNTRKNQTFVFQSGAEYKLINKGYSLTPDDIALLKQNLKKAIKKDDVLLIAGSLPDGIPAKWYADLISEVNSIGVKVFFDAGKNVLRTGVESSPYYIKPNAEEIKDIIGDYDRKDLPYHLKSISEKYNIENVVVTLGKDGVVAYSSELKKCVSVFSSEKFPKEVMTTGCGDSFNAGFLYGFINGEDFIASLIYGVAFGGANIIAGFPEKITMPIIKDRLPLISYKEL